MVGLKLGMSEKDFNEMFYNTEVFNEKNNSRCFRSKIDMTEEEKKRAARTFKQDISLFTHFDDFIVITPLFKNSKLIKLRVNRVISL